MFFESDKLRGRMAERGYNIKKLAQEMGVHENTLSSRLHSDSYFNQFEITVISKVLGIEKSEIPEYFFVYR